MENPVSISQKITNFYNNYISKEFIGTICEKQNRWGKKKKQFTEFLKGMVI